MRKTLPERLERGRICSGHYASDSSMGPYGAFAVQGPCGAPLTIIASGGEHGDEHLDGWEHVSVSTKRRVPNWQEMCFVKELFWEPEECVVQYHPRASEYVNNHPHVLHLWRHISIPFPEPPSILVGYKEVGVIDQVIRAGL